MTAKLIYLYIILLPLMNLPKPQFMGSKIQYADLIFVPIFVLFIKDLFNAKFRLITDKLDLAFLTLAVISLLSLLHSPFKNITLWDTLGLFYLISLYFVFTRLINTKNLFCRVSSILFMVTVFISILGIIIFILTNIFQVCMPHSLIYAKSTGEQSAIIHFNRPASLLTLPEMLINFALLGLTVGFICRIYYAKRRRLIDVSLALIVISTVLSFSRSLIGEMLFLTIVAFYFLGNSLSGRVLKVLSLAVFIILFCSALLIWIVAVYPVEFNVDESTGMAHLVFNSNPDTRVYLAKAALTIAKAHPFFGLGLGSYTDNFAKFLSKDDISRLLAIRRENISGLRIDPHSLYFSTLAEMGFLGFAALLFVFLSLFSKIKSAFKFLASDMALRGVCLVLLAAFCGFLLNGFFVDMLSMRSFWILMALGSVAANLANQRADKV